MSTPASPANPLTASLHMIFSLNDTLLARALDGLSDEEIWRRPMPDNNPMLWIAAHTIQTRTAILALFGRPFDTGWGDTYKRGSSLDMDTPPAKATVLGKGAEVSARLLSLLNELGAEQLAAPARGPKVPTASTMADILGFFAMHDSYHIGQLAYIRKALGHTALVG